MAGGRNSHSQNYKSEPTLCHIPVLSSHPFLIFPSSLWIHLHKPSRLPHLLHPLPEATSFRSPPVDHLKVGWRVQLGLVWSFSIFDHSVYWPLHEDGGLNPPHFYITHDEIQNALCAATCQPGPALDAQRTAANSHPASAVLQGAEAAVATSTTIVAPTVAPLTIMHLGAAQSMFEYIHVPLCMPNYDLSSSSCVVQPFGVNFYCPQQNLWCWQSCKVGNEEDEDYQIWACSIRHHHLHRVHQGIIPCTWFSRPIQSWHSYGPWIQNFVDGISVCSSIPAVASSHIFLK